MSAKLVARNYYIFHSTRIIICPAISCNRNNCFIFNKINIDYSLTKVFTGTYADLLIIVFHKLITTTGSRLQPLYDCLLTIVVNISPYLKSLSMVSSTKLLHLVEAFSTHTFLLANQNK